MSNIEKYEKILKLLYAGKKQKEIVELTGASIDVIKKISQMKLTREQFAEMGLSDADMDFFNDMWLDIVYLKGVLVAEDIKNIIRALRTFDKVNKDNIELSVEANDCRDREIKHLEAKINSLDSNIEENKAKYKKTSAKLAKPRKLIQSTLSVIESYDDSCKESYKELLYNSVGVYETESYCGDSNIALVLRRRISSNLFSELRRKNIISYRTRYTEINKTKDFCDAIVSEKDIALGYNVRDAKELSERILDEKLEVIITARKSLQKELRKTRKDLEKVIILSTVDFLDKAKTQRERLESLKGAISKMRKINEYALSLAKEDLLKNVDTEHFIIDNFLDVENSNFLIHTKDKNYIFINYNERMYIDVCSYDESTYVKNKLRKLAEDDLNKLMKKSSAFADEVWLGTGYISDKVYEKIMNSEEREKVEFEIYRKLNREFLFL